MSHKNKSYLSCVGPPPSRNFDKAAINAINVYRTHVFETRGEKKPAKKQTFDREIPSRTTYVGDRSINPSIQPDILPTFHQDLQPNS